MTVRAMLLHSRGSKFSLSGQLGVAEDATSPYDTTNAIKVTADGRVFEGDSVDAAPLGYTQVDTATDWLRPVFLPTQYYVRYSNVVGSFTFTPGAVDTAIALTSDRVWTVNRTAFGTSTVTFDLEILAPDMTTVLAGPSAYRVRAENSA